MTSFLIAVTVVFDNYTMVKPRTLSLSHTHTKQVNNICASFHICERILEKSKNLQNRSFFIGMLKLFTFTPQARTSNSFCEN